MKKYYLKQLDIEQMKLLTKRPAIDFESVFVTVRKILSEVKVYGDKALKEYTEKFDKVKIEKFLVSKEEVNEAEKRIPEQTKEAFRVAVVNIEKFHKAQVRETEVIETSKGVKCFRKFIGIEKVGLYIPGGEVPLPSTVLMLGILAKIAGCKEIVMCTPPGKGGNVSDIVLFVANLVGVTKIFKVGGAQAIAALAYGTCSIPKVYKIFGPGNQYVTAAKMLVSIESDGAAMDIPAGPSEVLVIADNKARADFVAADLLSQAEHGTDSQAILVCTDENKAEEILEEVYKQVEVLPRKEIALRALENSFVLLTENIAEAVEFSNKYAPEHLIINVEDADKYLDQIINAGSVFIGQYSCESAGDYASGTNHTLPTYGYAKAYSGISVDDFVKEITFQKLNQEGIRNLGLVVERMAEVEHLQAHKNAMTLRINSLNDNELRK